MSEAGNLLIFAALVIALIVEFQGNGRNLLGWAVVLVCAALLLPVFAAAL